MDLQIRVRKQILTCRQTVIAGSVNFVKAKFMFDDEWLGTAIHVIFSNGDIPEKEIILDETLECVVPWEVLETEGDLYISAVGLLDGDVRISTKLMDNPITVYPHGSMGGSDPLPPSPTIWDDMKSDWNENDPNKASYVKNRTHYKEIIERDYTVLPNVEPDPTIGSISYGKKLGLEIGKEYTVDIYNIDGEITTAQIVAIELSAEDSGGLEGVPVLSNDYFILYDGVDFDTAEEKIIIADNCIYAFNDENIEKLAIHGVPSVETIIHKVPNEYLPELPKVDQEYDSKSEKAQSGVAVEQAINEYDKSLIISTEKIAPASINGSKFEEPKNLFKLQTASGSIIVSIIQELNAYYKKIRLTGHMSLYNTVSGCPLIIGTINSHANFLFENKPSGTNITYDPLNFVITFETTDVSQLTKMPGIAVEVCYNWSSNSTLSYFTKKYLDGYNVNSIYITILNGAFKDVNISIDSLLSFGEE